MKIFRDSAPTHLMERRVTAFLIPLATLLLLVCTWAGTYDAVRAHRQEAESHLTAELTGQALSLETRLQHELMVTSETLRMLASAIQADPAGFDLHAWQHETTDMAAGRAILIANAAGVVRASTRPGLLGLDVASQDYFRAARGREAHDARVVTGALRRGAVPWQWELTLARRLEHPDGSFAGVIAAPVDTASLTETDHGFDLGANGVIALESTDDARLHPLVGGADLADDSSIAGSGLAAAIGAAHEGVWTGSLPDEGIQRTVAFRHVPGSNLAVLAGVDPVEAMRSAAARDDQAWQIAAAASLILLGTAASLLWLNARNDRRAAALEHDQAVLTARMRQLEAALAGMGDGIMMVDAELRLVEWNASFPDLTGVPRDILHVGMSMEEMVRAQAVAGEFGTVDVEAEVKRRMASIRTGGSTGMIQRPRPDGRVLELRRNPLPGGGFVTLYTDVSMRHAMEQRLHQSEKMAAVGRLTAGVAHDFNNLLATIVGSAELIERQVGRDSALARRLELIMQAAGRGSDLVRQLLAFARQQPLEPVLVNLNQILEGMAALLRATVGSRIRVETKLANGLWQALVDPVQIEHVVLNLAINARDAMADGGSLTVVTANILLGEQHSGADLAPGEYVTVALTDIGTGMTDDVLRKVFEPFFTTKGPGRESGLGLSQVYGVASQSGGGVEIVSQYGQGTTVTVFLPRGKADASRPPARPRRIGQVEAEAQHPSAARRRAEAG
ncbi:MAG TPA: PAS-domain containing protein [Acetobacteraceae bacterium]|jgi:signal transduction histidine kinase